MKIIKPIAVLLIGIAIGLQFTKTKVEIQTVTHDMDKEERIKYNTLMKDSLGAIKHLEKRLNECESKPESTPTIKTRKVESIQATPKPTNMLWAN